MSILRSGIKTGTFIEQMEGLVRLCSAKRINIRPGIKPCTNGKDTIWIPWLPNDASEEDKLRFFNFAAHEQSHFHGKTDIKKMSGNTTGNKTKHHIENSIDDMRCERLQEEEYPGLKQYRAPFYGGYMKGMLAEEFKTASASKDIVRFLHAVQSYTFFKVRYSEIGVTDTIDANDEVIAAYNKYVVDLIPRIKTHRTFKETLELGGMIYDRMKDMIREAMEKRTPPPPKPEPASSKKEEIKDEDDSDGRDDSGDDTESPETRGAEEPSDDHTEGESEDSGSTEDDADETGEDTDELPEEKSGEDKDSEGEDDSKDGEAGKKDEGNGESTDNDEEDSASDKGESGSGEEQDSEETDEEDGSTGDRSEDESEDPSEETERSDGNTGTEEPTPTESTDGSNEASSESGDEDTGDEPETTSDHVDSDDTGGDVDASSSEEHEEGTEGSSDEETVHGGKREGTASPGDSREPEEAEDEGVDSDEPDPVGDYEDDQREWEDKIVKAVEGVLREVEDRADELKTVHDENKETIEEHSADYDSPYMVHPNVKDIIEYNRSTYLTEAEMIKNRGLQMLGTAGARLTRLFVAQSYPRHIHNQYHGRFDMRSYMSDTMDKRMDIYSRKMGARLDKAAVSLMVDNSASMMACIGAIYCILSGLLHYLGKARIPTEVVGFTAGTAKNGDYRDVPVHLTIVKKFEDLYDSAVMQRCVQPSHMEQNAEVDCLRYMVPRLMARPETKKVLFILGDGEPCIGNDRLSEKLAAAYKEYIDLCKQAGIIVFGFGIGCNLRWVFGEDFVSVGTSDVGDQLLTKLTEVLNRPPVYHLKRIAA